MSSFLSVLLVLGGLIFFHELGHFLIARLFGIGVQTFSLGFGPRLFGWRGGQTDYRLSLVPLGGYVSLVGESDDAELPEGFEKRHSFTLRPAWQRLLVIAAGPVFNLLLAWFIYWGLFWAHGQFQLAPEVGRVQPESPAAIAGVAPGDRILSIGGKPVQWWDDVAGSIVASEGRELTIAIDRNGTALTLNVQPEVRSRKTIFGEDEHTWLIGIQASGRTVSLPLDGTSAMKAGLDQTWRMIVITGQSVQKIFERVVPLDSVGGPIMIAQMVSEQSRQGLDSVLALTALISINLGLLNLLPIPVLDGGHIIFLTMEMVMRRPVNARLREVTSRIGLAFLLALMLLATYNDIVRNLQ